MEEVWPGPSSRFHPGNRLVKLRKTMENLSQDGRSRESVTLAPGPRELGQITYMSFIWRPDYFRSKLCGFNTELIHAWTLTVEKTVIFSGNGMLQLDRGSLAENLFLSLVSWKWSCICTFHEKLYPNPQILQCLKILISTLLPILHKRWFCAISTDVMCV